MQMIYGVKDRPKVPRLLLFSLQQLLAILAATIAVPMIVGNGMQPSAALFGAGVGTFVYLLFTKFKSPVFLGSSFAFLGSMFAAFSGGAFGFLLLGCVFAFALCAGGAETLLKNEKTAKGAKIAIWTTFGLLCAVFLLFAVFTFSVPLPQTFMTKLFG